MESSGNLWKANLVRKNILLILIAVAATLAIAGWLAIQKSQRLLVANMAGSLAQAKTSSVKIMVSAEGMYALTLADLQGAGLPLVDLDPAQLSLSFRGKTGTGLGNWIARSRTPDFLCEPAAQPVFNPGCLLADLAAGWKKFGSTDCRWKGSLACAGCLAARR